MKLLKMREMRRAGGRKAREPRRGGVNEFPTEAQTAHHFQKFHK